jgi:hypothetical protein
MKRPKNCKSCGKEMQVGGLNRRPQTISEANIYAKDLAKRQFLFSGENTHVGNTMPYYKDAQGNDLPDNWTPIPQSAIKSYIPPEITSLEWSTQANLPYYLHPQTGDVTYTNADAIHSPRFQKTRGMSAEQIGVQRTVPSTTMSPVAMRMKGGKVVRQMGGMPKQGDFPDYETWSSAMEEWMTSNPSAYPSSDMRSLINPVDDVNMDVPTPEASPDPLNRVQEGIQAGIIEAPKGYNSAQEWYDYANTPADKKRNPGTPKNWKMNLGIGMKAVRTLGSEISGRVARARQNEYDYLQQGALGMMNPMPTDDYQPNPYSLYAKYGGSLKRYMQSGGKIPIYTLDKNDPRLGAYNDSMTLYRNTIGDIERLKRNNRGPRPEDNWALYQNNRPRKYVSAYNRLVEMNDEIPTGREYTDPEHAENDAVEYKKPIQPIIYGNRPNNMRKSLNPSSGLNVPDLSNMNPDINGSPLRPTPQGQSNYSFTYPTGSYNEQNTMYFPNEASWKRFIEGRRGMSSQQGSDYGTATGNFKYGGLQHVDYFGPPFSNGATYKFSDAEKYDKTIVSRKLVPQLFLRDFIKKRKWS